MLLLATPAIAVPLPSQENVQEQAGSDLLLVDPKEPFDALLSKEALPELWEIQPLPPKQSRLTKWRIKTTKFAAIMNQYIQPTAGLFNIVWTILNWRYR